MPLTRRLALGALCFWSWALTSAAQADGLDALNQFIKQTRSGQAQFTQVVTSPPKPGQVARSKTSSGSFEFQRPGKFRFDYRKPFVQTLVADGQTLWMHDVDLNQVTARQQAQVLGATPVALLTAATDLEGLKSDFVFKAEAERDGLQWVRATPKKPDGQIQSVLVGLRSADKGVELAVLDVQDALGQRSVLNFTAFALNPALPATAFVFKVPAGADVIRP
ncbi:MAG: outer membrane lipoprotein chaperone LolA [Limnohabitans sp.]